MSQKADIPQEYRYAADIDILNSDLDDATKQQQLMEVEGISPSPKELSDD